ncbi:MAG: N-acetylmuramoyl-L-alanine amidase, partial [Gammaproteobacteria bacterium]
PCPQNKKSCGQVESLNERLDKAKRAGAVLFISIHADAFRDPRVRGATVYALSDADKIPKDGEWSAMHHVKRYSKTAVQLSGGNANEVTAFDQSLVVGDAVIKELKKVTRMRKLSVRRAAFVVLKSNEIASILIETSYLSNPGDEKFLINPNNQQKIAEAILNGIKHYTAESRKGIVRIN